MPAFGQSIHTRAAAALAGLLAAGALTTASAASARTYSHQREYYAHAPVTHRDRGYYAHAAVTRRHREFYAHAASACANANTPVGKASVRAIRRAVVCLINQQRRERGLPALRVSHKLNRSAQGWSETMVSSGSFTHGADFAVRISAAGLSWQNAGENIATGYRTPAAVVSAWMASPGHCRNILDPEYSRVGTGAVARVVGFSEPGATWTQDFALPAGQAAPSNNWGPANSC